MRPRKAARRSPSAAVLRRVQAAVKRLARVFERTTRSDLAQMQRLLADWPRSTDAIYRIAHDLKGQGTTFGFPRVTAVATRLCRDIREQKPVAAISRQIDALVLALNR